MKPLRLTRPSGPVLAARLEPGAIADLRGLLVEWNIRHEPHFDEEDGHLIVFARDGAPLVVCAGEWLVVDVRGRISRHEDDEVRAWGAA